MAHCGVCGAPLGDGPCDYDVSLERAPGIGDPGLIAAGRMSHDDHELHIARWRVHHPEDRGASAAVMQWARERVARAGQLPPA